MCDKCQYNRAKVVAMGEEMSSAEKSREFYRRQGECRERERIIKLLEQERLQFLRSFGDVDLNKNDAAIIQYFIALIKEAK